MEPSHPAGWDKQADTLHADCRVFSILKRRMRHRVKRTEDDFYIIDAFDWVVVMARTPAGGYVMVNQYRFGSESFSWEFPAGCIDPGETPIEAALREFKEETGYEGERARIIGQSHPNPALQDNTCYFIHLEHARPVALPDWQGHEEMHIQVCSLKEIDSLIRQGSVHHAIVINALYYLKDIDHG